MVDVPFSIMGGGSKKINKRIKKKLFPGDQKKIIMSIKKNYLRE